MSDGEQEQDREQARVACEVCARDFKNRRSLLDHKRRFHKKPVDADRRPKCDHCDKRFATRQSRHEHMKNQTCLRHKKAPVVAVVSVEKVVEMETEIRELKQKVESLMNSKKGATVINNRGTINNTTNNHYRVSLGMEDMSVFSDAEKRRVLNGGYMAFIKIAQMVHLNDEHKEYQNVVIPNLKDRFAKCYDERVKDFVTKKKADVIEEIINYRTSDLKDIHEEFNEGTKLHNNAFKLIAQLENYDPQSGDENGVFYKQLFNELTLLFYNQTRNLG